MHGFAGAASVDFTDATLARIARYGLFVVSVGMRGRDGASGTQDASAAEIYDIYDVLAYIRSTFPRASATYSAVVGYSGGGGNALAAACKFPDAWCMVVSHFGMSDYGRDGTDGWYFNGGNTTLMNSWIGGSPATYPERYYARDATFALGTNYTSGHLYLFHDDGDTSVRIIHSARAALSMSSAGRANYTENYTNSGSGVRWIHGNPNVGEAGAPCINTEPIWAAALAAKTYPAWSVPTSGAVKVAGYIKTKRFEITLGTRAEEAANVTYDTGTGQYSVEPLTGTMGVVITQGAQSASQTISSTTVLQVA